MRPCRQIARDPGRSAQHRQKKAETFSHEPGACPNGQQIKNREENFRASNEIGGANQTDKRETRGDNERLRAAFESLQDIHKVLTPICFNRSLQTSSTPV